MRLFITHLRRSHAITLAVACLATTLAMLAGAGSAMAATEGSEGAAAQAASSGTVLSFEFEHWRLSGALTISKLNETVYLPSGSSFSGKASIPGRLEGETSVPPFTATVKTLGVLPVQLHLTFTEVELVTATIGPSPANGALQSVVGQTRDELGITEIGESGVGAPVQCHTAQPVVFPLETTESPIELLSATTAKGETTLPEVQCAGLLGSLEGPVITAQMSGPDNPFEFTIRPPE